MPLIWVLVAVGVIAIGVIVFGPFYVERRRRAIGPTQRQGAEGEFIELSQGITYCRWVGPVRGPVAVVVHGVSTPMISMETVAEALGGLGYRVVMYDLYGRGLSDAPQGQQNRQFFLRQLSDLCAHYGLTEEITVAGYSMGGSIATAFAAEFSHSIKNVILIASAGIVTNESQFSRFCRRTPLLGDWVHAMLAKRRILESIPPNGATPQIEDVLQAQRHELKRRGYLPALLSSRRGMLTEMQEDDHRKLRRQGIKVAAVWAGKDPIIPLRAVGLLGQWNRTARQEVIEDADHAMPYTHKAQMTEALRTVLRD